MTAIVYKTIILHEALHPLFSMSGIGAPPRKRVWKLPPITALYRVQFVKSVTGAGSKGTLSMSNDDSDRETSSP
jgi:hypothetical protein